MSLFQVSVLKKYLKAQDENQAQKAYKKFSKYFLNPTIQENIKSSKEEEYQGIFLTELFVNILGYTLKPRAEFNLVAEYKNETNARKADGAILKEETAIGVIELKGTNTKHLEGIRQQAFDYKANQKGCVYVITSNFEKLRFYINDATEFLEFDLFNLSPKKFELLFLCLHKENLLSNLPLKIKEASIVIEEKITKDFYIDYSVFKRELFRDLVKKNVKELKAFKRSELADEDLKDETLQRELDNLEKNVKLTLFKKSQKLIDRFLFIFFAEDRGLLPPNSIYKIIADWNKLKDLDVEKPLYERFKLYFSFLDTGRKGTAKKAEIFAYNGGLFRPDYILNRITIDDDLLDKHTSKLSNYNFESQVGVNILGHIFENSLNEIENVNAEIEGDNFDKQKSKRKKDGVFYTPKYITKYIVENTVGKLCEKEKNRLGFHEEDYFEVKKGTHTATKKDLLKVLDDYREWLLKLTICDPACGSGAFLNQALDFLIKEHQYIDELKAKVLGGAIVFSDIENTILENNIYGVDINEESVEIAKLSLWLRTAQPRRKLNDLSSNVKCGNSLIDSKAVAGNKAFTWEKEFPEVFKSGGFDVVVGNPPYVRQELFQNQIEKLKDYEVYTGKGDLYTYFYEKGANILKTDGILSFISSGKFFEASYGKTLVEFLVKEFQINEVINFDDLDVFKGISAYPLIFSGTKRYSKNYDFNYCYVPDHSFKKISEIVANLPLTEINVKNFISNNFKFFDNDLTGILNKINENSIYLKDLDCLPLVGIKTGFNDGFITNQKVGDFVKPYVFGKNIKKYKPPVISANIIFPYENNEETYDLIDLDQLESISEELQNNKDRLRKRAIIKDGLKNGTKVWYEFQQINRKINFEQEYIVYPNVSLGANFTISKGNVIDMTGFIIPSNDRYLLAILNSKLSEFLIGKIAITRRGGYNEYKVQYLQKIPIKKIPDDTKQKFISPVEEILLLSKEIG